MLTHGLFHEFIQSLLGAREPRNLTHEVSHKSAHENAHGSVHLKMSTEMPTKVEAFFLCKTHHGVPTKTPTRVLTGYLPVLTKMCTKVGSVNFHMSYFHMFCFLPKFRGRFKQGPFCGDSQTVIVNRVPRIVAQRAGKKGWPESLCKEQTAVSNHPFQITINSLLAFSYRNGRFASGFLIVGRG